jgi:hypothetical protein
LKLAACEAKIGLKAESDESGHVSFYTRVLVKLTQIQIEYKLRLTAPSNDRFVKLVTQLKWRLYEGAGLLCQKAVSDVAPLAQAAARLYTNSAYSTRAP